MTSPTIDDIKKDANFLPFKACLRKILGEIADWPSEKVDERIEYLLQNCGWRTWFGHDLPVQDAVAAYLSTFNSDRLMKVDFLRLSICLEQAIVHGSDRRFFLHEDLGIDWKAARQRVGDVLHEFDLVG